MQFKAEEIRKIAHAHIEMLPHDVCKLVWEKMSGWIKFFFTIISTFLTVFTISNSFYWYKCIKSCLRESNKTELNRSFVINDTTVSQKHSGGQPVDNTSVLGTYNQLTQTTQSISVWCFSFIRTIRQYLAI